MSAARPILLLNPPGDRIYIRDYYCSKVSKAHYTYQPVDLVIQSGILGEGGPIEVLDAIIERLDPAQCAKQILARDYAAIVFLAGAASRSADFDFMRDLRARRPCTLVGMGDVFMEGSPALLREEPWLDAVCLDFTSPSIRAFIDAPGRREPLDAMVFRHGTEIVGGEVRPARGRFEIPVPRHDLFPNRKYTYPFVRKSPFATVLTDYGCPYRCSFCIMGQLGYKVRPVENVMRELDAVIALGIREIYFADQTFGADRARTRDLLAEMARRRLGLGWVCFSRADVVDGEMLAAMRGAGCHTIIFGVESASSRILEENAKGITTDEIRRAFERCRNAGIVTVGTFMLGLPEDTAESIRDTIRFATELRCDYASFNVPVPRMLTPLRRRAIADGTVSPDLQEMDQSGTFAVMGTRHLGRREVMALKREAIFRFYLRPSYLLRRLALIDSLWDLKRHVLGLFSLVKNAFSRG